MVHRRLLALAGQLRGPPAVGILVGWLVMAARVTQAALIGVVLGRIFGGAGFASVTGLLVLIAVVVVVRGVLVWLREVVAQAAAASVKDRIRDRLYGRLVELGPGYLAGARTGATQATVVDGVAALEAYYGRYLPQLAVCLTGPVAIVVWMLRADVWVGATALVAVLAVPLVPRLWDGLLGVRGKEHWRSYTELGAEYLDSMQGMTTLLDRLSVGRTTVVIAHRLNTVRDADRIVVLVDGQVVEQGTHAELIDHGGAYRELVAAQTAAMT